MFSKSINSDIVQLIKNATGIKVDTIGKTSIERAIKGRMKSLGLTDLSDYIQQLKARPSVLHALVEEVVVPETWFFRDHYPFLAMMEYIRNNWDKTSRLRVLSIPCSTGEEPYSVVMTLMRNSVGDDRFQIDAVDISLRALEKAKKGKYTKNSFRGKELNYRDMFFEDVGKKFRIIERVRKKVQFVNGNILNAAFVKSLGVYDIIFCRNIFIYFDEKEQQKTIKSLSLILKQGGIIFTGHAEASLFINSDFKALDYKKAFAFIKEANNTFSSVEESTLKERKKIRAKLNKSKEKKSILQANGKTTEVKQSGLSDKSAVTDKLTLARQLADKNDLEKAAKICKKYLKENGPVSEAFFLLGVIENSLEKTDEAIDLLRKALYLDPQHYESLVLIGLLAERSGDLVGARNYKRRARKLIEGDN